MKARAFHYQSFCHRCLKSWPERAAELKIEKACLYSTRSAASCSQECPCGGVFIEVKTAVGCMLTIGEEAL